MCDSMRLFELVCVASLGACVPSAVPSATVSLAAPLPEHVTPIVPSAPVVKTPDDGDFSSDRGMVHLVAEPDGSLAGSYSGGVLTCDRAAAAIIRCKWYDSGSDGLATFVRKNDGTLDGTWGSGESDNDSGAWVLTPVSRGEGLNGMWDTNWGAATVTDTGHGLHIDYPNGTMDCELHPPAHFVCQWAEGQMAGSSELDLESPHVLHGRWWDSSAGSGGTWVFVKH